MFDNSGDSVDLWRQVASAVEFIAAVERPGFTVWDAFADAIAFWIEDDSFGETDTRNRWADLDSLRSSIGDLLSRLPPVGAHGGAPVSEALGAALSHWLERIEADVNDGCRFGERVAVDQLGGHASARPLR